LLCGRKQGEHADEGGCEKGNMRSQRKLRHRPPVGCCFKKIGNELMKPLYLFEGLQRKMYDWCKHCLQTAHRKLVNGLYET